jgi:hypothetical protein
MRYSRCTLPGHAQMADIFLSYATEDREHARSLAEALRSEGYDVWWDRTIPPGRVFDEVIQEALHGARCVVVLWSEASTRSNWVKAEADDALSRGRLVPALIAPVLPPLEFRRIQAANLAQWSGDHDDAEYRTLLAAIRQRLARADAGRPGSAAAAESATTGGSATRPRMIAAAALLVVLVVASLAWQLWPSRGSPSAPGSSAAAPAGTPARASGGERLNLLASSAGGELVLAPNERWSATIDGRDDTYAYVDAGEGVYGFKDGRAATFDAFAVLIPSTSDANLGTFELLAGNDLRGSFRSIGTFTTENVRIMREPYQEFRFPPVTAKYLKLRALKNHTGGTVAAAYEFRLYGTLQ